MKYLILLLCLTSNAFAQLKDVNVTIDSRYDRIENEDHTLAQNRIQDRVRIGFTYDVFGKFSIVGLAATGPSYGNDWNNIYNFNDQTVGKPNLFFRKLYLQKMFGPAQIQLGSLGGIDSIGSAGIGSSGWVDGLNMNIKRNNESLNVRIGSLFDQNNPNVFTRQRKVNFAEIEVSKKYFENLLVRAGYEHYRDDFLKGKMNIDIKVVGKKVITLLADVLYDVQQNAYNYDVGAKWDVLDTFMEGHKNYLNLDVYYSHLDPKLNFRNSMYSAYFQDGNSTVFKLSGKIDKKGKLNWMVRDALGKKNRFDAGLTLKLGK